MAGLRLDVWAQPRQHGGQQAPSDGDRRVPQRTVSMRVRAMRPARLIMRARRLLRRFQEDKRGVSAVEFAMLLPLMVTLYIGGVEVSSAIAVDRKVTLVARTVGDLVAQSTSVNATDMTNILNAASSVVQPYQPSLIKVTVSRVAVDGNGAAKVVWSKRRKRST